MKRVRLLDPVISRQDDHHEIGIATSQDHG
jgi:hypothetical protein